MSATTRKIDATSDIWTILHPLSPEDSVAITALRSMVAGMKGKLAEYRSTNQSGSSRDIDDAATAFR